MVGSEILPKRPKKITILSIKEETDIILERSHGFSVAKMGEAQNVTASQSQTDIVK